MRDLLDQSTEINKKLYENPSFTLEPEEGNTGGAHDSKRKSKKKVAVEGLEKDIGSAPAAVDANGVPIVPIVLKDDFKFISSDDYAYDSSEEEAEGEVSLYMKPKNALGVSGSGGAGGVGGGGSVVSAFLNANKPEQKEDGTEVGIDIPVASTPAIVVGNLSSSQFMAYIFAHPIHTAEEVVTWASGPWSVHLAKTLSLPWLQRMCFEEQSLLVKSNYYKCSIDNTDMSTFQTIQGVCTEHALVKMPVLLPSATNMSPNLVTRAYHDIWPPALITRGMKMIGGGTTEDLIATGSSNGGTDLFATATATATTAATAVPVVKRKRVRKPAVVAAIVATDTATTSSIPNGVHIHHMNANGVNVNVEEGDDNIGDMDTVSATNNSTPLTIPTNSSVPLEAVINVEPVIATPPVQPSSEPAVVVVKPKKRKLASTTTTTTTAPVSDVLTIHAHDSVASNAPPALPADGLPTLESHGMNAVLLHLSTASNTKDIVNILADLKPKKKRVKKDKDGMKSIPDLEQIAVGSEHGIIEGVEVVNNNNRNEMELVDETDRNSVTTNTTVNTVDVVEDASTAATSLHNIIGIVPNVTGNTAVTTTDKPKTKKSKKIQPPVLLQTE